MNIFSLDYLINSKRRMIIAAFVIAVSVLSSLFITTSVSMALSYKGPWYGRQFTCGPASSADGYGSATTGYFNGSCYYTVGPVVSYDSRVVPTGVPSWVYSSGTNAQNMANYVSWLQSLYNSGGRGQVAAAFMVKTMLGNNAPGGGVGVSAAQWNDLATRLSYHTMSVQNVTVNIGETNTEMGNSRSDGRGAFDVMAFRNGYNETQSAMVFKDSSGTVRYTVFIPCANPIGTTLGLSSSPPQWTVRAESYIKVVSSPSAPFNSSVGLVQNNITATPGDLLNFAHDLRAQSADINQRVWYTIRGSGFPTTFTSNPGDPTALIAGSVAPTISNGSLFVAFGAFPGRNGSYMSYTVTQNDVGKTLCQAIEWQPTAWNNGNASSTVKRCASVPYNYNLTPKVYNVPTAVQSGVPVKYTASVTNAGPTKSRSTEWRLVKFILPPNIAVPSTGTGSMSPESYFGHGATKIAGTTGRVFNVTTTQVANGTSATPGLPPGNLVCFALSVAPYSHANSNWRYGTPACAEVAKSTYVSVSGGDLLVGRNVAPSPSASIEVNRVVIAGNTYGSYSEYAAFAPNISNIATGGNLATTTTRSTPSPSGNLGQPLTFANNKTAPTCTTIDGCFNSSMGARSDLYTKYTIKPDIYTLKPNTANLNLSSLTAGKYYYKLSSPLSIGGNLSKGVSVIVNTTANITIASDIAYHQGPYTKLSDLPQLILATRANISISNGVKKVDSWLYATGTISTCDAVQAPASYTAGLKVKAACDKNLLIANGPLSTGHLQLRRTYGADPNEKGLQQPAESFNLRPDAYLWSYAQADNPKLITTVFTRELPPRF